MKIRVKQWLWLNLVAVDQLINTILGGWPDETISARVWRHDQSGRWFWKMLRRMIDLIFAFHEKNHCRQSFENEERGGHRPYTLRPSA